MTSEPDTSLVTLFCPSPNFEPRKDDCAADMLLLHYTGMESVDGALAWLTTPDSKVSCHYLIDEQGRITQMVAEEMRAWHAGKSRWAGDDDINSCSIGIEIHNRGHDLGYPDFPDAQMNAVEELCRDILKRNKIPPERVLAHSDVAPARKSDPGEKFDWSRMAAAGIGFWVKPEPAGPDEGLAPDTEGDEVRDLQEALKRWGYGIESSGIYDEMTCHAVRAFQRHWRPEKVNGRADVSTRATLERLMEKLNALS